MTTTAHVTMMAPPAKKRRGVPRRLFTLVNVGTFFLVWELFARSGTLNPLFFPAPTDVLLRLVELFTSGDIWVHLLSSFQNFMIGMILSCIIAIPLGLAMGGQRLVAALVSPYVWALAAMPTVALVPLAVLLLGFTDAAKLALIVVGATFPIMINVMDGVKTVDVSLVTAARVFGAKPHDVYARVVLPNTAPFVIAGVNQGMTQALIGLVVGEMFATNVGLGYLLVKAQLAFDAPMLYAVMLLLIGVSLSFVQIMNIAEKKAAPWRERRAA